MYSQNKRKVPFKYKVKQLFQRRFTAAALGFLVTFMLHSLRINLGIAMVAMINNTNPDMHGNGNDSWTECPAQELYNSTNSKPRTGEFLWSPELQGYIQSAGYLGNVVFQIPGGILAKKFGAKYVIIYTHLVIALSSLLSPIAARTHPYIFLVLTLLRGMAQAVLPPALSVLSGKWFPRNERGFLGASVYNGFTFGALMGGLISGILCDLEFLGGWPLVFYTFGLLSAVIALLFYCLYYDTPEEDPWISKEELAYILQHQDMQTNNPNLPTPWLRMITSSHTNILVLAMFGAYWMGFYFLSIHPTYLGTILHFPIKENGAVTGFPNIVAIFTGWFTLFFSYIVSKHRKMGVTALRKVNNSLSCLAAAIGILGIYFAECDILSNIIFLYVANSCVGFTPGGSSITAPDVSPTFCGPLMGYASTLASLSGFVATVMVGYLTNEEQNLTQWGKIFLISASVYTVTGVMYQLFGSAEIQPWDPAYKEALKKEQSNGNGNIDEIVKQKTRL